MRILEHELSKFEKFGINLGLDRIEYLLDKLGNPHKKFKSIHVAGTNGKGSVCAMLSSILKESGLKVAMYTSPHLFKYNERIKINGKDISDKDLEKYFKKVTAILKHPTLQCGVLVPGEHPTIFEILTAMAFKYFADKKVDIAVVEVGMGGRFDATNVLIPEVSVITTIDFDHTEYLGKTLKKIAFEKAGIIKPGVPVVVGKIKKEALDVIKKVAKKNGSDLYSVTDRTMSCPYDPMPLIGPHQKQNAAVAVKVMDILCRGRILSCPSSVIKKGLRKTRWPGRFQVISKKPLIIVDGAHNPAGIRALKVTIAEQKIKTPLNLIFGVQRSKDVDAMVKEISPIAKNVIVTQSSHPGAMPAGELAGKFRQPALIDSRLPTVICGSIFLIADMI